MRKRHSLAGATALALGLVSCAVWQKQDTDKPYGHLPEVTPPFAAKATNVQALELMVDSVPAKTAGGGFLTVPRLVSGNKQIESSDAGRTFSLLVDSSPLSTWSLWTRPPLPAAAAELSVDSGQRSFAFLRRDAATTFSQSLSPAGDGKALFHWDFERAATDTKRLDGGVSFNLSGKCRELGVSVDSERLRFSSDAQLMRLPAVGKETRRKQLQVFANCETLTVSPDKPENGFTLRFDGKTKLSVMESLYYGKYSLHIGVSPEAMAKGAFTVDLGPSAVAPADAPPPVNGVDFWKHDRMHVPASTTKNLMPNPSFEQGLRYWNWIGFGSAKYEPQPGASACYQQSPDARFGNFSLQCNGTWGNRPLQSFPFAVRPGKDYCVSFFAKASQPARMMLGAGTHLPNGKPTWQDAFKQNWDVDTSWRRHSFVVKAGSPSLQLFLSGPAKTTVWLDGVQVEEGTQATAFAAPVVEGRLATANPDNSLEFPKPPDASMELSGVPCVSGEATVTVFNYYREILFERSLPFALDQRGLGSVPLPWEAKELGSGVFVVKAEYRVAGQEPLVDYHRFSLLRPLAEDRPTKELFGNSAAAPTITRGDDLLELFKRWGWGSTSWAGNLELFAKHGIPDYCAVMGEMLSEEQRKALWGENYRDYGWHGAPKFPVKLDVISSPEQLKLIEQFSHDIAKQHPQQKRWAWDGELDGRSERIRHGDFSKYAKIIEAMHRGIKRAIPDAIVLPDQGPASATVLNQVSEALSTTKGKVRWDAVAIHHYNYCDFRDERTVELLKTMRQQGYGDTPVYFTEGCAGGLTHYVPEWDNRAWNGMEGRPSYDTSWREFTHAAFAARSYLLTLKYWPQVQFATLWLYAPYLDLNFAPLMLCGAVNNLAGLFANPKFVADIHPLEDVKGLVFEDGQGRGLAALWMTGENGDVELGLKPGAMLRVDFGSDTPEFIDLMGNVREAQPKDGLYEIPLSPAPLFVRGPKGSAARLAAALDKAMVIGGGSTVRLEVVPSLDGKLTATLANKTSRPLAGTLLVGNTTTPFKIPASGKSQVVVASGPPTAPGNIQAWSGELRVKLDDSAEAAFERSLAWFVVPHAASPLPLNPDAPAWKNIPALPLPNWFGNDSPRTGDLDAKFQLAWDKDNLYLRVEADDDQFVLSPPDKWRPQPSSLYNNDGCVEVYFDSYANARGNPKKGHDDDDYRYDFFAGNEKAGNGPGSVWRLYRAFEQYAGGVAQPSDQLCASGEELKCEFRREGGRYSYVMLFPLRYIMPIELKQGAMAGFGLYLHDKEPGDKSPRKGLSLATEPGAHCNQRPDLYPLMLLGN